MKTPTPRRNHPIKLYKARQGAARVKIEIPYVCKSERQAFKKLDTTFYHPSQKLWSIANTEENMKKVNELFGSERIVQVAFGAPKRLPEVQLTEASEAALNKAHQKMVIKGFSQNTIQTYLSALRHFFKYFENKPLVIGRFFQTG